MGERFGILMVCTANLCRSPMMELLLRKKLVENGYDGAWAVSSAGTTAVDGLPMHPSTAAALSELEVVEPAWRSRRLDAELVAEADLVLAASIRHRQVVVETYPAAVRSTFLFLPFAAQVQRASARPAAGRHPGARLIDSAVRARSYMSYRQLSAELPDPMGGPLARFRAQAIDVDAATAAIVDALGSALAV